MTDKNEALLPCPFCGDEYNMDVEKRFDGDFFVECGNMDCEVQPITNDFSTKKEAVAAWNTRSALSPNAVVIPNEKDVLKKLLGKIRQKRGFYSVSVGTSEVKQAHKSGILKGLDAAEKLIEEAILSQYGEQK
jgi:hypothetical protein